MNLDDYGYFDGGLFVFHKPFPFLHEEGVTLLRELDYRRFHAPGIDIEDFISRVLEKQLGIPDPLTREREPHQETPKTDPGE